MGINQIKVRAILDTELANQQNEELKHILEHQDKRTYTVVDIDGMRTIDGQSVPSGNSIEVDITNIVLIKNGFTPLSFDAKPFYSIKPIDQ